MIGGFFLGRYAINRDSTKQCVNEQQSYFQLTNRLANSAYRINNLTVTLSDLPSHSRLNSTDLYTKMFCKNDKLCYMDYNKFNHNFTISEIIVDGIERLNDCYYNVSVYLESFLNIPHNASNHL